MTKIFPVLLMFIFILFSCKSNKTAAKGSQENSVLIVHDTLYQDVTYSIQDSVEKISLEVYLSKLNRGAIRYRYKGNSPLKNQISKLDTLLSTVLSDSLVDFDFNTLSWGRLNNSSNRDFTLAKRLVLFANKSNAWNKKLGRPNSGTKNDFIKLLKNDFSIELQPLFKRYNYNIESISAEKILVYPAEKLPFWAEIKSQVDAKDKFPFDCQLWFTLNKIQ